MDYKKKYEEALERAKKLIVTSAAYDKFTIEKIFPELKESDDEKIRKDVLAFIRREGQHIDKYKWHKWTAWLEKQGNPTKINPSEFDLRLNKLLQQFETLPKKELANSLSFYLNVVQNNGTYKPEKQGQNEQILDNSAKTCNANKKELGQSQVTKTSDQDEMAIDIATKAFNHNIANDSYCKENCKGYQETGKCYADWDCKAKRKAEQNLAWSEEDEELLNGFIKEVESELKRPYLKGDDLILNKKISWLKALKQRLAL